MLSLLFLLLTIISCDDDSTSTSDPFVITRISGYLNMEFRSFDVKTESIQDNDLKYSNFISKVTSGGNEYQLIFHFNTDSVKAGIYNLANGDAYVKFYIIKSTDTTKFENIKYGELRLDEVRDRYWMGSFGFEVSNFDDTKTLQFTYGSIKYK